MLLLHPFPLIVYLATFTILIRYLLAEDIVVDVIGKDAELGL